MPLIDKYIDELRRAGDTSVILLSESEPRLKGKGGERSLEGKISHKEVTALVEEIVPPECFADLVMMEPVEFPFSHEAGELSIRVVPGPSIWRVVADVRGDGLAPLPAGERDKEEGPSETLSGLGAHVADRRVGDSVGVSPAAPVSVSLGDPVGEPLGDPKPSPGFDDSLNEVLSAPSEAWSGEGDDLSLSEMLLADEGTALDDADADIDLASIMREADDGLPDDSEDIAGTDVSSEPYSAPPPSAFLEQEQRSTKRLQEGVPNADPALSLADDGVSGVSGASDPGPSGLDETPVVAEARPVEPLEIDFPDEDEPQFAIEALDSLLDAAWSQGATGVLLRDHCVPLMVRGGAVSSLPFSTPDQGHLVHDIVDAVASPTQAEQLEIMGQCQLVYLNGSSSRLRCTLVQDGGSLAASVRRIGEEHLPEHSKLWMPDAVREVLPAHGLVLVCGAPGQGKTTTASALAAIAHELSPQTVVVADPLERRLSGDGAGLLQRRIPDDVPNCAQALGDVHLLEAPLVLVDVPRPDKEAWTMLSLASQGRVVIATWTAPDCVEAIQGLMDALPPELAPAERARRVRSLSGVIAVQLVPAASGGVAPLFEVLRTNPALLGAVAESRLDTLRGTEIRQMTFESSRAILQERGLL